ncbi:helix-turn-helix transcriptional regulator [Streptomyces olivaceoviridis]|uniref:helix-turn-helix transcriptional regulator n=1 Tax=Streptomyces olivaceoviridis TaxID=1921 RepID=UPI00367C8D7F
MTFIGREGPIATLRDVIDRGLAGSGGALLVTGEPGIGKTALLHHVLDSLEEDGPQVLTAVATEPGSRRPFAALAELLRPVRVFDGRLPPGQREVLRVCLDTRTAPDAGPFQVASATLNLLAEAAARRPVLQVIENMHWLDAATAAVVTFAARRLSSEPIVLLATLREGFRSPADTTGLPVLPLDPLGAAEAAALVDAQAPGLSPVLRARVLAEGDGNPLVLVKLARVAREAYGEATTTASPPPVPRVESAFRARLAGLPPLTRLLLLIAAVHQDSGVTAVVEAAQVIAGESVHPDDLAPAVRGRLITVHGGELRFRHSVIREAVLSGASPEEHRRVRAAVDRTPSGPGPAREPVPASGPGPDDDADAALEAAAEHTERGGVLAAVAALDDAARITDCPERRAELLLRAADLAVEAGRRDEVARLVDRADAGPLSARQRARAAWTAARFHHDVPEGTDVVTLIELAEDVAADGDGALALRILWTAALHCVWEDGGHTAAGRVAALAERLEPADEPLALAVMACAAPVEHGARVLARLRHWAAHPSGDAVTDQTLGTAAVLVGAFELAASFSAAALNGLRAQGRFGLLAKALTVRAWSAALLCDLTVAVPSADAALQLATETSQPVLRAAIRATQALIAALGGRFAEAEELATEAIGLGGAYRARPVLATAHLALAQVAAAQDCLDGALDRLRQPHDPASPAFHPSALHYGLVDLVDVALRAHRAEEVRGVVRRAEEVAAVHPSPALHIGVRFARAVLADDADAERLFSEALAADLTRWPFARARTQLAYGEWLRRRRRDALARTPLRAARDAFDALGAVTFAERARRELRASGEASAKGVPDARELLSPQELEIALMVAEGLTNREIGERLYVSHRTVSSHLHRIFPKLGVTSRTALGRLLRSSP